MHIRPDTNTFEPEHWTTTLHLTPPPHAYTTAGHAQSPGFHRDHPHEAL